MYHKKSRRKFISSSIKAGVAISVAPTLIASSYAKETSSTNAFKKLKILILGGTSFLGPHQIAKALERGHSVSTFTRGKTKPSFHRDLFEQVEQLIGDRENDLSALENRTWDVVIDNSGHRVAWTKKSAELLKNNCGMYLYTSSTGVFYPYTKSSFKEEDEVLLELPKGVSDDEKYIYDYGIMKANSELAAINAFGTDKTIVIRPTYMIGPADKTNRFIHWPIRLSKGGDVLVPGKSTDMVQYIDVRDVADWMINLIEKKKSGTYNAVGPKNSQNMFDFVTEAATAFKVESNLINVDDHNFLQKNGVEYIVPWIMPIGNNKGSSFISNSKAKTNGLTFRPLKQTVKDTYDWWNSEMVSQEQRDKVEKNPTSILAKEQKILKKWKTK